MKSLKLLQKHEREERAIATLRCQNQSGVLKLKCLVNRSTKSRRAGNRLKWFFAQIHKTEKWRSQMQLLGVKKGRELGS